MNKSIRHRDRLRCWGAVAILAVIFATGCAEEPCEQVACQGGSCIEGGCVCEAGFEGEFCQVRSRDRMLGPWEAGDICRSVAFVYEVEIAAGEGDTGLLIDNLNDEQKPVTALVNGLQIELPQQEFGLATISGSGGIDTLAQVISIEYRIMADGQQDEVCQAAFRKP